MRQVLVIFALLIFSNMGFAQTPVRVVCNEADQISNEWLVRWRTPKGFRQKLFPNSALEAGKHLGSHYHLNSKTNFNESGVEISRVKLGSTDELQKLATDPRVLSIESNCRAHLMAVPNDPDWSQNIGQATIRMAQAWAYAHDTNVIVAVPDTGIEITHPDLAQNIWRNEAEFAGAAGVDDDQNGYVDDFYGWNFAEENNDVTPGTYAGAEHGTHLAGILGAAGNNAVGTAGVAWKIKIMALRPFQKTQEVATSADLIESIHYAVKNGAQIINCSWGSERASSLAELEAFQSAEDAGVLIVAAAGNDQKDSSLYSPAGAPTVFSVGSINSFKELSSFSSFGAKVGSLAPGGDVIGAFGVGRDEGIFSTLPQASYGLRRGTSMSAPFVSGVAALIKNFLPKLKPAELRKLISETGDRFTFKTLGQTYTYSVLNAEKALASASSVSKTQPNCAENCVASGTYASVSNTPVSSFGGSGCALVPSSKSAGSGSAPWDIAFLFSFLMPSVFQLTKKQKPNSK